MQTTKGNGTSTSVVDVHCRDLKKYPPLSKVEFDNAVSEMRNGSESAFQKLMLHNARFVIKIAHKYYSTSAPLEDLIQAGYLGLAKAIRMWDPDRKNTFTSYAVWWIKLFMYRELTRNDPMMGLRGYVQGKHSVHAAATRLYNDLEREPTVEEVATKSGIGIWKTRSLLSRMHNVMASLDKPRTDWDDSGSLHDLVPDQAPIQDEVLEQNELSELVRVVVDELPDREREFIVARYGVGGGTPQTLKKIGKDHGYSKETARLVIERAENELRYLFRNKLPTGIKNTIL